MERVRTNSSAWSAIRHRLFAGANAGLFLASIFLSGCGALVTRLPDGQVSVMNSDSNRLRGALAITPAPLHTPMAYIPIKQCSYVEFTNSIGGKLSEEPVDISLRIVKDRLLVVVRRNSGTTSTYLISERGTVHDFNTIDLSTGERVTPDNHSAMAYRKLNELKERRDHGAASPHVINEFSIWLPEYTKTRLSPGDIAASVLSEDGRTWAKYRYRGFTVFDGKTAAVLDLERLQGVNRSGGPVVVGFNIVDLDTMLPMIAVLNSGSNYLMKRVSCSR
jgi:hypothetical protein